MRRAFLSSLALVVEIVAAPAQAAAPEQKVTLSLTTASAVVAYLKSGGTYQEALMLAARVVDEINAPQLEAQRQADIQRQIDEAVTRALADKASADKTGPPAGGH